MCVSAAAENCLACVLQTEARRQSSCLLCVHVQSVRMAAIAREGSNVMFATLGTDIQLTY
jgi:hypothetical protein